MRDLQVRHLWGRWVASSVRADYKHDRLYAMGAWGKTRAEAVARLVWRFVTRGLEPWREGPVPGTEDWVETSLNQ